MIVAVLLPSKGRPEKLAQVLIDLTHQLMTADFDLMVVVAALVNDGATIAAAGRMDSRLRGNDRSEIHIITRPPESTAVDGWNRAYKYAYELGVEWFVLGADDINFYCGCIDAALAEAKKSGAQVIGLNDMHTNLKNYAPHYMAHRAFTRDHLGGVMAPPVYKSWWFDREVCEIAMEVSQYAPAWDAVAKHDHHTFNREPAPDDTYREALENREKDEAVYQWRRAAGYPIDYEPVIGERMV